MKEICIAVDKSHNDFNLQSFASDFPPNIMLKLGLEYFTKFGLHNIQNIPNKLFIDLKLFDIPNTVHHAVKNISIIPNVSLLTLHAMGGTDMIKSAIDARNFTNSSAKIICVTKLTSTSATIDEVLDLTSTAINAGADGIVCSPLECLEVRKKFGNDIVIVTPGIRPTWHTKGDDQLRTLTPREAINGGASVIVIGRPITQHTNPHQALQMVVDEIYDL